MASEILPAIGLVQVGPIAWQSGNAGNATHFGLGELRRALDDVGSVLFSEGLAIETFVCALVELIDPQATDGGLFSRAFTAVPLKHFAPRLIGQKQALHQSGRQRCRREQHSGAQ